MVKHLRFAKIRENRKSFPPRMFCRILRMYIERYNINLVSGILKGNDLHVTIAS